MLGKLSEHPFVFDVLARSCWESCPSIHFVRFSPAEVSSCPLRRDVRLGTLTGRGVASFARCPSPGFQLGVYQHTPPSTVTHEPYGGGVLSNKATDCRPLLQQSVALVDLRVKEKSR